MAGTKKALTNTAWLFSEKIITLGITFVVNVFLARYLAPEQYGQYNFVLSFLALITPFTSLGLNALVTREIVNGRGQHKVLTCSLALRVIGGIIGAVLSIILLIAFSASIKVVNTDWLLIAAIINIPSAFYVIEFYFQAEVASKYLVFIRVSTLIISSLAKISGLFFQLDLGFFIWVFFVEFIVRAALYVCGYLYYNRQFKQPITQQSFQWDSSYSLELLGQSKWLILSGFMSVIYLKIDQIMLGQMSGASELGIYSVAAKLSEVWYFFPVALTASFFPKLLKSRNNKEHYTKQLEYLCATLLWMAIIIAIFVTLLGPWLVPFAFGDAYSLSVGILNVHIWAGCFIFMRALLSKWLIAEGLLKFSLVSHGIAAIVNITLNYILIPEFGGMGAAVATLISYASSSYFVLWLQPRTRFMAVIMSKSVFFPFHFVFSKAMAEH